MTHVLVGGTTVVADGKIGGVFRGKALVRRRP